MGDGQGVCNRCFDLSTHRLILVFVENNLSHLDEGPKNYDHFFLLDRF